MKAEVISKCRQNFEQGVFNKIHTIHDFLESYCQEVCIWYTYCLLFPRICSESVGAL